jgi:hypothetical protein
MIGMAPSRLVADCGGCIDAMAMTIPLRLLETAPMKGAALGKLVEALPSQLTLFLMTDDPSAATFADWYHGLDRACDITLISVGADAPVLESEIWSQDPWMAAEQGGQLRLHYLRHTDRPGRQAFWLSAHGQLTLDEPLLQMAGGNILTGPDFRILGTQSIELTRLIGQGPVSFDAALASHRALDPRPLHVFGFPLPSRSGAQVELRQQPHHLDLVLSVTGRKTPDGRPLLLLADPRAGPRLDGPRLAGWAEQLDASARRLEADGFAIIRNKVPYTAHPQWAPNPALRAYNNVFLENDIRHAQGRSRPLVWLPHFSDLEPDLEPFDRENRRVWEDLGFEPVPVYGWSALVRSGGAIRCASKVLRRRV